MLKPIRLLEDARLQLQKDIAYKKTDINNVLPMFNGNKSQWLEDLEKDLEDIIIALDVLHRHVSISR